MLLPLTLLKMRYKYLGWIYTDIGLYLIQLKLCLAHTLKNLTKLIINKYKSESGTLIDTLWFVWRALRAHIPMRWQQVGRCAFKHNWPITIYLNARAWFMHCWLLIGRRWRNRRQRPLVLNICKCHKKAQWVTVTLTDNSVKICTCLFSN